MKARSQWVRQRHDTIVTTIATRQRHSCDIPIVTTFCDTTVTRHFCDTTHCDHFVSQKCRTNVVSHKCRVAKCGHNGNHCRVAGMSLSCRRLLWSKVFDFFSRITGPIRIKFGMSILYVHTTNHAKFQIFWFWQKTTKIVVENRRKFEIFAKIRPKNCKNSWYY